MMPLNHCNRLLSRLIRDLQMLLWTDRLHLKMFMFSILPVAFFTDLKRHRPFAAQQKDFLLQAFGYSHLAFPILLSNLRVKRLELSIDYFPSTNSLLVIKGCLK